MSQDHGLVMQGRYWIMNPIDGMEGFENLRQYGISLALLDNGTVVTQSVTSGLMIAVHKLQNLAV